MRLTGGVGAALIGVTLMAACGPQAEQPQQGTAQEEQPAKDRTVRLYIQDSLVPYLDSLAKEVCKRKDPADSSWFCPGPRMTDYKKPPKDGQP